MCFLKFIFSLICRKIFCFAAFPCHEQSEAPEMLLPLTQMEEMLTHP